MGSELRHCGDLQRLLAEHASPVSGVSTRTPCKRRVPYSVHQPEGSRNRSSHPNYMPHRADEMCPAMMRGLHWYTSAPVLGKNRVTLKKKRTRATAKKNSRWAAARRGPGDPIQDSVAESNIPPALTSEGSDGSALANHCKGLFSPCRRQPRCLRSPPIAKIGGGP